MGSPAKELPDPPDYRLSRKEEGPKSAQALKASRGFSYHAAYLNNSGILDSLLALVEGNLGSTVPAEGEERWSVAALCGREATRVQHAQSGRGHGKKLATGALVRGCALCRLRQASPAISSSFR